MSETTVMLLGAGDRTRELALAFGHLGADVVTVDDHTDVQALIDEYRFDLVILLENNTPWVADGLRSLGSSVDRKEFQTLLVSLLKENEIDFVHVKEADYDARFLRCVELVKEMLAGR